MTMINLSILFFIVLFSFCFYFNWTETNVFSIYELFNISSDFMKLDQDRMRFLLLFYLH